MTFIAKLTEYTQMNSPQFMHPQLFLDVLHSNADAVSEQTQRGQECF